MFSLRRLRLRYCNEYSCEVAVGILKQRLFGPWHMVCGFDSHMGWSSVVCCYRPAGAPRSCGLSKRSGGPLSWGWSHGMGRLVTYYIVISPSLPYLVSVSFLGTDSIALLGLPRKVLMVGPGFFALGRTGFELRIFATSKFGAACWGYLSDHLLDLAWLTGA